MRSILAAMCCLFAIHAQAGDWPQILGPHRNGQAKEEKLPRRPTAKVAWRAAVGSGYAGPAIAEGRVVVFDRQADEERVQAFDLASGKQLWQAKYEATYRGGIDPDIGPRCVPTIFEGRVYVFGAGGDLHCLQLDSGKKVWSRNLAIDYEGPDILGYFGAGSSPIVAGGHVWVNLGGKNAGLVALHPATGQTVYKGTTERASYSSPTLATINGEPTLIFVTRYNCLGVDPKTGAPKFSLPFGMRGPTVNAATPLVFDNKLFISASYGVGAKLLKLTKDAEPKVVWENDSSMSSQYTTCVYHDGHLYGVDGREDIGVARLRCIEADTGDVKWEKEGFGIAHLILVDGQLLVVRQDGELMIAPASPAAFEPTATAQVAEGKVRALPAFSQGKLLLRTVASDEKGALICVELQ